MCIRLLPRRPDHEVVTRQHHPLLLLVEHLQPAQPDLFVILDPIIPQPVDTRALLEHVEAEVFQPLDLLVERAVFLDGRHGEVARGKVRGHHAAEAGGGIGGFVEDGADGGDAGGEVGQDIVGCFFGHVAEAALGYDDRGEVGPDAIDLVRQVAQVHGVEEVACCFCIVGKVSPFLDLGIEIRYLA